MLGKTKKYRFFVPAITLSLGIVTVVLLGLSMYVEYKGSLTLSSDNLVQYIMLVVLLQVVGILISFRLVRDSHRTEKELELANVIIETMCFNYNAIYYVDFSNDSVRIMHAGERIMSHLGGLSKVSNKYGDYLQAYTNKFIYPHMREEFLQELSKETILQKLQYKDCYEYTYVADKDGTYAHFRMRAVKIAGSSDKVVIGFASVSAQEAGMAMWQGR